MPAARIKAATHHTLTKSIICVMVQHEQPTVLRLKFNLVG